MRTRTMIEAEARAIKARPYDHLSLNCNSTNCSVRPLHQHGCVSARLAELRLEWKNAR